MRHCTVQEAFGLSAAELAGKIGDLRYDDARDVLRELAEKFKKDAAADRGRGRPQLAGYLQSVSCWLKLATQDCARAWRLSEPYMR
jgi:hypothetical protein